MEKQKLNYRFHNPNTAEATADILLKVFIEANAKKVVQEAANWHPDGVQCEEGHSA